MPRPRTKPHPDWDLAPPTAKDVAAAEKRGRELEKAWNDKLMSSLDNAWKRKDGSVPSRETSKICRACGKKKPLSHFYKNHGNKDGYRNKCKKCVRADQRKYHRRRVKR